MNYPIFTGTHGNCHIQGIAVDHKKGYIYYSFTTMLIKSTLQGEIIGSVMRVKVRMRLVPSTLAAA